MRWNYGNWAVSPDGRSLTWQICMPVLGKRKKEAISEEKGEQPEKVAECLDIMAKSVVCNSLLTVHNDWRNMGMTVTWKEAPIQLDAAFGAVNAIQEMLFSWQEDALSILPALPKRLTSGTVRGMEFPGGKIDIHWEKSGHVTVVVYAERNLDLSVLLNGVFREKLILCAGQNKSMEFRY